MTVDLDPSVVAVIALGATGLAVVALVLAIVALVKVRHLRRDVVLLHADDDADSFVAAVARQVERVDALRGEVTAAQGDIRGLRADLTQALRHVAVVRYDAFQDMGGRMSFSVALLDDSGDGIVVSSINGRTEARTYTKTIQRGGCEAPLSPEETEAIDAALRGAR